MRNKEKKKEKRSGRGRERLAEEAEQPLGDTHTETHRHTHAHKKTRKHTQLSILAARAPPPGERAPPDRWPSLDRSDIGTETRAGFPVPRAARLKDEAQPSSQSWLGNSRALGPQAALFSGPRFPYGLHEKDPPAHFARLEGKLRGPQFKEPSRVPGTERLL